MKKRIVIDRGQMKEIAKLFQCTDMAVSMALNFKRNSLLAKKIRMVAIKDFDGVIIERQTKKQKIL